MALILLVPRLASGLLFPKSSFPEKNKNPDKRMNPTERCRPPSLWSPIAVKLGVPKLAPHDLRRSCARLWHTAGGELEQIQFLLGHVSVQTTEKYLGCKQRLRGAVND